MPLGLVRKEPQLETPARARFSSRVPVLSGNRLLFCQNLFNAGPLLGLKDWTLSAALLRSRQADKTGRQFFAAI